MFSSDFYRMTGIDNANIITKIVRFMLFHQIRFVYWLRRAQKGSVLGKVKCFLYARKYGLEISTKAKIGKGLYLGHPYNITVGNNVILGDNVNLHKGCTIGAEMRGNRAGTPKIGNEVWIGMNATIVGNISVGSDVLIAPGAFVNFDVPDHSIVIGNPGVVHSKEWATNGYINFIEE